MVWEGSGGPSEGMRGWGGMGAVGRPSCRDGKGQEVLLESRKESGVSPIVPRGSQEALSQGWAGLGGFPGARRGGRPS